MKKIKPLYIALGGIVIIAGLFAWNAATPGRLDAFAECLGQSGAKFYGAFWCPHCQEQKQEFGKSAKKLPYIECSTPDGQRQLDICKEVGIQSYPTWVFKDGVIETGVLTPEKLSEKTGCELPA